MTAPTEAGAGVAVAVEILDVTQAQADSIDAAWRICSMRSGRRITGDSVSLFDDAVASVLGFAPPPAYALNVIATGAQP